jgi:hypothetical protein
MKQSHRYNQPSTTRTRPSKSNHCLLSLSHMDHGPAHASNMTSFSYLPPKEEKKKKKKNQ